MGGGTAPGVDVELPVVGRVARPQVAELQFEMGVGSGGQVEAGASYRHPDEPLKADNAEHDRPDTGGHLDQEGRTVGHHPVVLPLRDAIRVDGGHPSVGLAPGRSSASLPGWWRSDRSEPAMRPTRSKLKRKPTMEQDSALRGTAAWVLQPPAHSHRFHTPSRRKGGTRLPGTPAGYRRFVIGFEGAS
jgi:hypothetical protein